MGPQIGRIPVTARTKTTSAVGLETLEFRDPLAAVDVLLQQADDEQPISKDRES